MISRKKKQSEYCLSGSVIAIDTHQNMRLPNKKYLMKYIIPGHVSLPSQRVASQYWQSRLVLCQDVQCRIIIKTERNQLIFSMKIMYPWSLQIYILCLSAFTETSICISMFPASHIFLWLRNNWDSGSGHTFCLFHSSDIFVYYCLA